VTLLKTVLRNRALALLELTWATAQLGLWAFSILLSLYAYRAAGAGAVALTLTVRMVPAGLAAPYTSMLADRHSRRAILVWSAVVRALALAAAAVAAAMGAPLAVVLAFAVVVTVVETAHRPANAALMPQLASTPAELAAANVLYSAIGYLGFLLGSLLTGIVVSAAGLAFGFGMCAAAFVATALIARGLPVDVRPPPLEETVSLRADLAEGFRTAAGHAEIRLLLGVWTVKSAVEYAFDVLLVIASLELLGLGEDGAGWLNTAWGVGGVVGGAVTFALLARGQLALGLTAGLAISGAAFGLIGVIAQPAAAYPLLVVMGVGFVLLESAYSTLTQRLVADDVLARVFGVEQMLEVIAAALGSIVAGTLVGAFGVRWAIVAVGLVLPLVATLTARRVMGWEAGAVVPERAFALVRRLPVFAPLPVATQENLAMRLAERRYADGEAIVREGEPGEAFYVIADGEVVVTGHGRHRRRMGEGEYFGEIALLRDVPRTATVTADGPVTALAIEREAFLGAVGAHVRSAAAAERSASERLAADAAAVETPGA
jgi:MFS family permease